MKNWNYNSNGAYSLTLCIQGRHELLGKIVGRGIPDAPFVELTEYGKNVIDAIEFMNGRNSGIYIDKYAVMPNHVHLIVSINGLDGASGKPRPTNMAIPKLISSIKRYTNKQAGFNMWQDSYHDHIIRDETEYQRVWQYLDNNPEQWEQDEYNIM